MKKPEWSSTFEIGVSELDDQHRALFMLASDTWSAIKAHAYQHCEVLSEQFVEGLARHFASEEAFLARIDYHGHRDEMSGAAVDPTLNRRSRSS